jgi:hypothetical protein
VRPRRTALSRHLFLAEPDPPKWLYWWGLAITAFDVLIALGITRTGATTAFSPRTGEEEG